MAEKLKEFDFTASSPRRTDGSIVYHWDEWFDGDIWKLTSGEDFPGHPLMMERIIRTRATNRGAQITLAHVCDNGDGDKWGYSALVIQRVDVLGPEEARRQKRRAKAAAARGVKKTPSKRPAKPA